MTDYISGKVEELGPTQVVIDNNGIGYRLEISLQTYAMLEGKSQAKVFVQSVVNTRDGGSVEYGFANKDERALFQLITSVSGMPVSASWTGSGTGSRITEVPRDTGGDTARSGGKTACS